MTALLLSRFAYTPDGTFGRLTLLGLSGVVWQTCEDDWRDNEVSQSCIPTGTYTLRRVVTPKHGETFQVTDVPGRSAILIHSGNTEEDVQGCILLGLRRGCRNIADEDDPEHRNRDKWAVLDSRVAFEGFMRAMSGVQQATLTVAFVPAGREVA